MRPEEASTFKLFLLDEAWLFFQNETIRTYVLPAQKTWRKQDAAMILATQSLKELQESGHVTDGCGMLPDKNLSCKS